MFYDETSCMKQLVRSEINASQSVLLADLSQLRIQVFLLSFKQALSWA